MSGSSMRKEKQGLRPEGKVLKLRSVRLPSLKVELPQAFGRLIAHRNLDGPNLAETGSRVSNNGWHC